MAIDPILIGKSALRLAEFGKKINLVDFLPSHLENSEVGDFVQFFETFLNQLYYHNLSATGQNDIYTVDSDGTKTFYAISATSAGDVIYTSAGVESRYEITSADTISILEKAKRINQLHDPDYIDIEFIQRLANLMGYNITIHKGDIEESTLFIDSSLVDEDVNKYLRFIVSNLPNWYKLKSTNNAIKVLLYSFGVVGEVITRWTSDSLASSTNHPTSGGYGNDQNLWSDLDPLQDTSASIRLIPQNYFSTPHFLIRIDLVRTPPDWFYNINKIIDAVDVVKPICNVLDGLELVFNDTLETNYVRMDEYYIRKDIFPFNTSYPIWLDASVQGNIQTTSLEISGIAITNNSISGDIQTASLSISGNATTNSSISGDIQTTSIEISGNGTASQIDIIVESGNNQNIYVEGYLTGNIIEELV